MKKYMFTFLALLLIIPSLAFGTAETLTGARAGSSFAVAGVGLGGSMKVAWGVYNVASAVERDDIFELCKVPRGAIVVGGRFYAGDLDTGTEALDIDIGWGTSAVEIGDTDGFLDSGVLTGDAVTGVKPETGTSMPFGGVLLTTGRKKFNAETTIQAKVVAAAGTFSAGTIGVVVYYNMD